MLWIPERRRANRPGGARYGREARGLADPRPPSRTRMWALGPHRPEFRMGFPCEHWPRRLASGLANHSDLSRPKSAHRRSDPRFRAFSRQALPALAVLPLNAREDISIKAWRRLEILNPQKIRWHFGNPRAALDDKPQLVAGVKQLARLGLASGAGQGGRINCPGAVISTLGTCSQRCSLSVRRATRTDAPVLRYAPADG
jgi:hypothetical protein